MEILISQNDSNLIVILTFRFRFFLGQEGQEEQEGQEGEEGQEREEGQEAGRFR